MLFKLSLTGIKSRLKDYIVLFSGLTISSAIFYMFMSMALNQNFLGKNSMMSASMTGFIFAFGAVLLSIITLVYIVYANSFLLSMRQRDYGMYMMLGAKSGKIGILIFLETMVLGVVATLIGIILGLGLTQVVSNMLISQLGLTITGFVGFYLPAVFVTLIFFVALFFIAALFNRRTLLKTPVLELLHGSQKPVKFKQNAGFVWLQALLGIVSLAIGYAAMINVKILVLASIPIALVTIVLGSYLVFNSLFTAVINVVRKNHKTLYKGLRSFTLNQLRFRITDYTRILSMISILFALALGAITVGLGFEKLNQQFENFTYYDAQIVTKDQKVAKEVAKLDVKTKSTYDYKIDGGTVYFIKDEFEKTPLKAMINKSSNSMGFVTTKVGTYSVADLAKETSGGYYYLNNLIPNKKATEQSPMKNVFLTQAEFDAKPQTANSIDLLTVKDFKNDAKTLQAINNLQEKKDPRLAEYMQSTKVFSYLGVRAMTSGFEFMGFFLGIAFLTMLASTLMFKILSGAQSDVSRYEMLSKIGVRRGILRKSISTEIGVLFALPGILGIVHVLFGLQFFKAFLADPYDGIWLPFTIFIVLYMIYYLITVWLYQGIVLKKIK